MNDQNNDQNDDKDLFRSMYGDIERVDDDRVPEWRQKPRTKPHYQHSQPEKGNADISPWPELAHSESRENDSSIYRANGVQDKLIRRLRRGQLKPQASIDLHGMTRTVALRELQAFIAECRSRGIHSIHIVHGKGLQSDEGKAVLKPSVAIWLKQMSAVLAYCPAQIHDGGDGALYVLLKK